MMRNQMSSRTGHYWLTAAAMMILATPAFVAAQSSAQTVTRVEEDWVLWVLQPDGVADCPQFHTIMSPTSDLSGYYFMMTWNYWEEPKFSPGGFQVQCWNGTELLDTSGADKSELSLGAEVITWTQVMQTNGTQLGFTILDGHSQTWGDFGYPETTIITNGDVMDLSRYSPDLSTANAGISFGRNRVAALEIRTVRYYNSDGDLIKEDDTPRKIYMLSDAGL